MRRLISLPMLMVFALANSPAFAHGGDHSRMSLVELVTHLSANWDHRSTIVAIGVAFALAAVSALLIGKNRTR